MPKCKSPKCQAIISFTKTEKGNRMATDPGIVTIIDPHTGKVHKGLIPHKVTCKDPDFFSRSKPKRKKPQQEELDVSF